MSQGFKLRYDQMRDSNPAPVDTEKTPSDDGEIFHTPGHVRNLCLVWPDGRRFFLNYAYLIASELNPGAEINEISLNFSSHSVLVKGYRLEPLFMQLLDHLPRIITAIDPRYVSKQDSNEPVIVSITVGNKD